MKDQVTYYEGSPFNFGIKKLYHFVSICCHVYEGSILLFLQLVQRELDCVILSSKLWLRSLGAENLKLCWMIASAS